MKKIKFLLVLVIIFVAGIIIVGCNKQDKISSLKSDNDLLAFYSLTSASILDNDSSLQRKQVVRKNLSTVNQTEEIDMQKINSYMQMMESMFSDNPPVVIKNDASDRIDYETKIVFEATDLSGKKDSYILYYNQTQLIDDDDDDYDEMDNEIEYKIDGIAIIENQEYQIFGETETEKDEQSLDIIVKLDDNNYVVIEQEVENNEQEYEYTIYKEGKKFTSISFEVENGKEFEAEFITNEQGYKETYLFYKEGNIVKIKYRSNQKVFTIKATASIDPNTNETIYEYKVMENNLEYKFKD